MVLYAYVTYMCNILNIHNYLLFPVALQLGMVHNKLMQGGLGRDQNTVALTAYVTIALLEANVRPTSYINRTHSVRDCHSWLLIQRNINCMICGYYISLVLSKFSWPLA